MEDEQFEKMIELKTLKDIEVSDERIAKDIQDRIKLLELDKPIAMRKSKEMDKGRFVYVSELRKIIIEHIKSGKLVEGAKFWAMDFANLIEEDLK